MKFLKKFSYLALATLMCCSVLTFTACEKKVGSEKVATILNEMKYDAEQNWELKLDAESTSAIISYEGFATGSYKQSEAGVAKTNVNATLLFNCGDLKSLSGIKADAEINMSASSTSVAGSSNSDTKKTAYVRTSDTDVVVYVSDDKEEGSFYKSGFTMDELLKKINESVKVPTDEISSAAVTKAEEIFKTLSEKQVGSKFIIDMCVSATQNKGVTTIVFDYDKLLNTIVSDVSELVDTIEVGKTTINDLVETDIAKKYINGIAGDASAKEIYDSVLEMASYLTSTVDASQITAFMQSLGEPTADETLYDYVKRVIAKDIGGIILGETIIPVNSLELTELKLQLDEIKSVLNDFVAEFSLKVKDGYFAGVSAEIAVVSPAKVTTKNEIKVSFSIEQTDRTFADLSGIKLVPTL